MKFIILTLVIIMPFCSLQAISSGDLLSAIEGASSPFGGLIAGHSLSTGRTPGFGHFSISAGIGVLVFRITNPAKAGENFKIGSPVMFGEMQVGIWNGRHMPMSGVTFFRSALVAKCGFIPVPKAVGSNDRSSAAFFYAGGLKIGILQGGLLFPDASMNILYSKASEIGLFNIPRSNSDTTFEISVSPHSFSLFIDVSKRLFYVCPYLSAGYSWSTVNGEYSLYQPSTDPGIQAYSRGSVKSVQGSFVWKFGAEISVFPFVNADAEAGMFGKKWMFSAGLRLSI
ncbi:hypothetical protein JW890_05550 [candidate division WOR-3 bacterium]|nr:hypothetical protein [candidate division WOR-3 bacterium]